MGDSAKGAQGKARDAARYALCAMPHDIEKECTMLKNYLKIAFRNMVKSQSLCKIIEGHAASLYEIKSV